MHMLQVILADELNKYAFDNLNLKKILEYSSLWYNKTLKGRIDTMTVNQGYSLWLLTAHF